MNEETSMVVKKHSALIQSKANGLSIIQRKAINFFIFVIQETEKLKPSGKEMEKKYTVPISIVKKICNCTATNNVHLKSILKTLASTVIEFNYLGKVKGPSWQAMSLLSYVDFEENVVNFKMVDELKEKIVDPEMFCPINANLLKNVRNAYTLPLYEFLKDYLGERDGEHKIPILEIGKFKNLIGVENKYKEVFKDFKRYVLDIAVREINDQLDIRCAYTLIKYGRKYKFIKFQVERKTKPEMPSSVQLSLFNSDEEDAITEYAKLMANKNPDGYAVKIRKEISSGRSGLKPIKEKLEEIKKNTKRREELEKQNRSEEKEQKKQEEVRKKEYQEQLNKLRELPTEEFQKIQDQSIENLKAKIPFLKMKTESKFFDDMLKSEMIEIVTNR